MADASVQTLYFTVADNILISRLIFRQAARRCRMMGEEAAGARGGRKRKKPRGERGRDGGLSIAMPDIHGWG